MKSQKLIVKSNIKIKEDIYCISLIGNCSEISRPGQFVDILIDDLFLRRPFSIYDHDDKHVEILYRVVGRGTEILSKKTKGDMIDVLFPLGNGFDVGKRGKKTLLVAGGIGLPPIYELTKLFLAMQKQNKELSDEQNVMPGENTDPEPDFKVLLGFRSSHEMFAIERFWDLGVEPVIATEEGPYGIHGNVVNVMRIMKDQARAESGPAGSGSISSLSYDYDYVMCCGPEPMLKAVYKTAVQKGIKAGQFSFEERMGCGFGACMGCSCRTKYGYKRICRDGPVLDMDEIIW